MKVLTIKQHFYNSRSFNKSVQYKVEFCRRKLLAIYGKLWYIENINSNILKSS